MKLPTHDVPGHETIYVECDCDNDMRKTLFKKLKESASDNAIKVRLHNHNGMVSIINDNHNIINMYKHIVCTSLLLNVSWIKAKESHVVYLTLTTQTSYILGFLPSWFNNTIVTLSSISGKPLQ